MTSQLLNSANVIFVVRSPRVKADFHSVMTQLDLTEDDLLKRTQYFQKLIRFWLFVVSVVCIYAFYLIAKGIWLGVVFTAILIIVILLQAFRYHFWLFQIKQRKLGCSVYEWFQALGKGK